MYLIGSVLLGRRVDVEAEGAVIEGDGDVLPSIVHERSGGFDSARCRPVVNRRAQLPLVDFKRAGGMAGAIPLRDRMLESGSAHIARLDPRFQGPRVAQIEVLGVRRPSGVVHSVELEGR